MLTSSPHRCRPPGCYDQGEPNLNQIQLPDISWTRIYHMNKRVEEFFNKGYPEWVSVEFAD